MTFCSMMYEDLAHPTTRGFSEAGDYLGILFIDSIRTTNTRLRFESTLRIVIGGEMTHHVPALNLYAATRQFRLQTLINVYVFLSGQLRACTRRLARGAAPVA